MWNSTRKAYAPLRELSKRVAKWLSANVSNSLACTGVSAVPMQLSPYGAPGSADASRTSGNAAPLAGRLHDRTAFFIFLSCTLPATPFPGPASRVPRGLADNVLGSTAATREKNLHSRPRPPRHFLQRLVGARPVPRQRQN